jgi:hypothetical protein
MLQAYPQIVPPPLLSWALAHCQDVIQRQPKPDEIIKRGMLGEPYMQRWHLLRKNEQSGLENIYLHRFVSSDPEDLHDHPWANASIVLSGRYVEQSWTLDGRRTDTRVAGDVVIRNAEDRHAITGVEPGTTTLFITGPKVREWGFWLDGQFVHWLEYRAIKHRERNAA